MAKVHEDFFLAMTKEKKSDSGAVSIFSDNFNLSTDQVVVVADTSLQDSDECVLQYGKMRLGLDETHLVFCNLIVGVPQSCNFLCECQQACGSLWRDSSGGHDNAVVSADEQVSFDGGGNQQASVWEQ